ncbi:hypothetical protein B0A48_00834 [Cryoendolithus antarcticus]|uniref:Uncharacterized protein n=1 Tax=Cryoendolithus antarcticus TaxID=1507870 RepID=A0A1V8TRG2_9PEZI|nr:hypothetical protein B0A48_00834 [Cryoendolithus antarcticus]
MMMIPALLLMFMAFAATLAVTNNASIGIDIIYGGVSLFPAISVRKTVDIGNLKTFDGEFFCTSLAMAANKSVNVDWTTLECRAYIDAAGLQRGSAPFRYDSPALLSTNEVVIGSILCYVV